MDRDKKEKRRSSGKAGTTMVEVLIAFLIVMIMMVLFARVMLVAIDILEKSKSTIKRTEAFNETYYKTEAQADRQDVPGDLVLSVDLESTDANNRAKDASMILERGKLKVYQDAETGMKRYSFYVMKEETDAEDGK